MSMSKWILIAIFFATSSPALTASIWHGVARPLAQAPSGNRVAVSCHNCYNDKVSTPQQTWQIIHQAQAANADLIELDVHRYTGDSIIYVSHTDPGSIKGPRFAEVISDAALRAGNQMLFIEIKGQQPLDFARTLVDTLYGYGYFSTTTRPVFFRSFHSSNLANMKSALANNGSGRNLASYARLSQLFWKDAFSSELQWHTEISRMKNNGMHMVEFHGETTNLFSKLGYARSLGLGINMYTYTSLHEVWATALRNNIDAITIEGANKPSAIQIARSAIGERNQLFFMDLGPQTNASAYYYKSDTTLHWLNGGSNAPSFERLGTGQNRFGGSFVFNKNLQQAVRLFDADNVTSGGYFVTAVVDFDDLSLDANETQAVVQKADSGAFALELHRPGTGAAVLRFGVFVNGAYHYASHSVSGLSEANSYHLIGAYDGSGCVHLWVDMRNTSSSCQTGGVVQNNSPITLGADPQGATQQRYFLSGKLQQVSVLAWNNH